MELTQLHEQPHQLPPKQTIIGCKYRWLINDASDNITRSIAYAHSLSMPIAHVLASRGMCDNDVIRSFLFGSYEQDVPAPHLLKGADIAAQRIIRAIKHNEKILVFGDYDVDGVTAVSITLTALIPLGANINFYLPDRNKDGYGLSEKAVRQAHKNGYSLIITVDNGITAFDAAKTAQALGVDLIITDHHRPQEALPPAIAIVNPNQSDCSYPFKHLAGAGVTFKLMALIYQIQGISTLPEKLYELLLLGTVADVVPLVGENRFWVRHGLHRINHNKSNAIQVLASNSNLTKEFFNSLDIGFSITPQINALGRLTDPRDAVRFMISDNREDVEKIGKILKDMNEERKRVEGLVYKEIEQKIEAQHINLSTDNIIIATARHWPSGVIGLVAGKLTHNYGRPTLLFHVDEEGIAKGSCRSITEFNIFDALNANSDLLIQYGGHAHAAGLKLKVENLEKLKERLSADLATKVSIHDLQPKLTIDAALQLPDMTQKMMSDLEQLEPFGNQNPQPLFWVKDVTLIKQPQVLKEKHVKCMVFSQGIIKPVIFFNRPELVTVLQQQQDKPFALAAHATKNEWGGMERSELQGIDIAI
jgi:single-stranded-DNA-specific exonuclease